MKILTDMTDETILAYNRMCWENGEAEYCLADCGDAMLEILADIYEDNPDFLLSWEFLAQDAEDEIDKQADMIRTAVEDGEDKEEIRQARTGLARYKRQLQRWKSRVATGERRWLDTDGIDTSFETI